MDISSYRAQMVVSPWWTDIFSYFHPVFLWSLIWGQSSIISKLYRNIKSGFDPRCRKRERLLSWIEHVTGHKVVDLNSVWKDGRILCDIIQDSCPETDISWDHFSGHTFHRGQTLITRCLQIQPAFCESDFTRKDLTPELEKRLFRYLSTIRQALNHRLTATSLSLDDDSDAEPQVADEYIARGMGLLMASRNRHAIFYIYSRDGSSLYNIRIEIQGPEGDYGLTIVTPETQISTTTVTTIPIDYRLTTDYLRVSYQPRNLGNHELSLTHYGYIIPGSPFHISVDDTTNRPGKRYASIDWLTIDEEEEIRKKEEIKKKCKVKCRIVDFVTEQMYLTDDGKLVKILPNIATSVKSNTPLNKSQKYLTPHEQSYSRSRSRSISPRRKNVHSEKKMYNSLTYKAVKKLLSMTPVKKIVQVTDASAQVQLAEYKTTSVVFKEKCKKIVNTCDFLLKNLPKQTSLDILNNATRILQSPTRHEFKQFSVIDSEELESIITEIKSTAESEIKSTETELTSTAVPKLSVTINSIESDNDDVFLPDVHQLSNKMITNSARFLSSNIYDGLNDISEMISETNTDIPNRLLSDNSLTTEEVQHSRRSSGSEARLSFKQEGNTKSPNRRHSFSAINRSVSQEYLEQQSKLEDDDILTITDNVIDITGTKDYQTLNKSEIFVDKSVETDCKNEYILEVKQDDLKGKNVEILCKNEHKLEVKKDDLKDRSVEIVSKTEHFEIKQDDLKDKRVETDCKNEHKLEVKQDESKFKVKGKLVCKIIEQFETHMNSNECSKNDKFINLEGDVIKNKVDGTIKNRKTNQYYGILNSTNLIENTKENQAENNEINHNADIYVNNKISDREFKELIAENNSKQDKDINNILNEEVKQSQIRFDILKIDQTNHEKINKGEILNGNKDGRKTQLKESECTETNIAKTNLLNVNNTDVFLSNITCDTDFNEKKLTDRVEMIDNGILNEDIKENHTDSDNFKTDKSNYEINKDDIDNVIKDDKSKTQLKEKTYTKSNIENNDKKGLLDVNKKQDNLCQNTTSIRDVSPESKRNDIKTTNRFDQEFEIISEKATTLTKNVKIKVNTIGNIKKICSLFESNFMNNEKKLKSEGKEKINETAPEKTKSQSDMHILKRPSDFQPRFSSIKTGVQTNELEMKEIEPLVGKIKINKTVFESQSSPSKSEIHALSGYEQLKEPLEVWEIKSHLCETVGEITETSENKNTDIKLSKIVDLCNDEYKPETKFVKPLPFEEFKSHYDTSLNKSYNQTKLKSLSLSSRDERVYRADPQIVIKMIRSEPEIVGEIFRAEPAVVEELFRAEPAIVEEFCRSESVEVQEIIGAKSSVIRDFTNRMCSFVSSNETYKKYLDSLKGIEGTVYDENKTIFKTNQTLMNEIEMPRENCQDTNNVIDEHGGTFLKNEFTNIDLTIQEPKEIKTKKKPTTISNLDKAEYKRPKVMPRSSNSTKTKVIDIGEVNKFENKQYQNPALYTKLLSDGEYNFSKENVEIKTEQTENKRSNKLIPKSPDKFIGIRIMPRGWMQENNQISKDRTGTELLLSKDTQGEIPHEQSKQVETIVTEEAVVCIEETTSCETEKIHKLKINDIDTNLNIKETERDKKENTLDYIFDNKEEGNYTNGCNVDISNDILTFDSTKEIVVELSKEVESIIPTIEIDIITNTAKIVVNEDSKVSEYKIADIKKDKTATIDCEISRSGELIIADVESETVITEKSITEVSEVIIFDNEAENKTNIMEEVLSEDRKEMKPFIGDVKSEIMTNTTKAVVNENDKVSMSIISIENVENITHITKSFVSDDSKKSEDIITKGKNDIIADNTKSIVTEHGIQKESTICYVDDTIAGFTNDTVGEDSKVNETIIANVESKNKRCTKEEVFDRESKELYIVEITADRVVRKETIDGSRPIADAKVKITPDIKIPITAEDEKEKNAMTVDVNDKITTAVMEDAIEEKVKTENVEDVITSSITDDYVAGGYIEKIPNTVINECEITRDHIVNELKENESIIGQVEVEVQEHQLITGNAEGEITNDHVAEIITKNKPITPVIEGELTAVKAKQEYTERVKMTADINSEIKTKHVVAEINESTTYIENKITILEEIMENIVVDRTEAIVPEDSKEVEPIITEIIEDIMVDIFKPSLAEIEPTVAETTHDILVEVTEYRAAANSKEIQPTVTEITKDIMVDIIKPSLAEVEPTVTETTDDIVVGITESRAAENSKEIQPTVTEITKDIMVDIIKPSLAEVESTVTETTDDIVVGITESRAAENSKEIQPTVTEITKDIMVDIIKPSLAEVESTVTETTDDIVVGITESRAAENSKEVQPTVTEITKDIMVDIIKPSLAEVESTVTETTDDIVVGITESRAAENIKEIQPTVIEITKDIMVDIIKPSEAEVESTVTETTDDIVVGIIESRAAENSKEIQPTVTEITKDIMVDIIKPSLVEVESTVTATTHDIVVGITESRAAENSKEIQPTVTEITKDIMVDIIKPSLAEVEPTVTETTDDIVVGITESRAAENIKEIQPTVIEITKDIMVDIIKPSEAEVESTVTETTDDIVVGIIESRAAENSKEIQPTVTEITKDIMVDIIKPSLVEVESTVTATTHDIVVGITESRAAENSKEIQPTVTEITKDIMVDIIKPSLAEVEPTVTETTDDIVVGITESRAAENSKEIQPTVTEITKDIMVDIIKPSLAEVESTVTETTDDILVEVTEYRSAEENKEIKSTVTEITKGIMVDIIKPCVAKVEPTVSEIIEDIMVDITEPIVTEDSKEMEAGIIEDNMTNITEAIVAADRKQDEHIFTENTEDIIVDTIKAIIEKENKDHKHYIAQITEGIMVDINETSVPEDRKEVGSTVNKTTDDIVVNITELNVAKDTTEDKLAITKDIMVDINEPTVVENSTDVKPGDTIIEYIQDIMVDITEPILAENSTEVKFANTEVTPDIMVDIIKPIVAEDSTEVKLTSTEMSQDIVVDVIVKIVAEDSKNIEHLITDTAEKKVTDIIEEIETKDIEQIKPTTEITKDVVLDINKTIVAKYSKDVRPNITEITEAIIIDIKEAITAEVSNNVESIVVETSEDNMIDITEPIITEESIEDELITKITEDIMLDINELIVIEDSKEVKPLITEISEDNMENMIEPIKTEESKYIEPITKITEDIMLNMNQHIVVEDSEEVEPTIEIQEDKILDITKATIAKDNKEVEHIIIEITQDAMVDNTEVNVIEVSKKIKEGEPNITEMIYDVIVDTTVPTATKDSKEVEPTITKITENIMLGTNEHIVVENSNEIAPAITEIIQDVKGDIIECIVAEDSKEDESIITEITEDKEVNITETMSAEHITEYEPTITKITQDDLVNITEHIVAEKTKEDESMITNIKEANIVDITEAIIAEDNKKIKEVEPTIIEITQDIMVDITEPIVAEDSKEVESKITEENIVDNTEVIIDKDSKKIKEVEPTITEITQDVMVNITEPGIAEDSKVDEPTVTEILEDIMLHNNKVVEPIITEISQDMVDTSKLIVVEDSKVVESTINDVTQEVMGGITEPIVTKHNKEVQPTTTEFVENKLGHIAEESLIKESKEAEDAITEFAADILLNITETLVAEDIIEVELPITEIDEDNVTDIREKIVVEDNIEFEPTITKTVTEYSTEVESTISDIANEMYILVENTKVVEPTISEIAAENIVEDSKEIDTSIIEIEGLIVAEDRKDIYPTIKGIAQDFMIDFNKLVQPTITVIAEEMVTDIIETIIEEDNNQVEPTFVIEDINEVEPIITEIVAQDRQVVEPTITKTAVKIVPGNSKEITEEIIATITQNFVPEQVEPAFTEIVEENNKGGESNITEIEGENVIDTFKTYVPDDRNKVEPNISELSEDIMVNIPEASVLKVKKEVETIIYEIVQHITEEKVGEESNEIEPTLSVITEDFIVDIHETIVTEDREKFQYTITEITEDVMVDIGGKIIEENNKKVEPPITEILEDIMLDSTGTIVEEDRKEVEQPITEIVEGMLHNVETIVEENKKDPEIPITVIAYDITTDIIKKIVEDSKEVELLVTEIREDIMEDRSETITEETSNEDEVPINGIADVIMIDSAETIEEDDNKEVEYPITEIVEIIMGDIPETIVEEDNQDIKFPTSEIVEDIMADNSETIIEEDSKKDELRTTKITKDAMVYITEITEDIMVDSAETIVEEDRKGVEHHITKNIVVDKSEKFVEEYNKEVEHPITQIAEHIIVDCAETVVVQHSKGVEHPISEIVEDLTVDIAETMLEGESKDVKLPITEIVDDFMIDITETIVADDSKEFYTTNGESEITTGISNVLFTKDNKEDELICYVDEENILDNTNTFPAQYIKEDDSIFPDFKVEITTDKQNKDIETMSPVSELNIAEKNAMNNIVEMIAATATDLVKPGSIEDDTKVQAICVTSGLETINVDNTKEQTIVTETELGFVEDTDERQMSMAIDDIQEGGMKNVLGKLNFAKISDETTIQIKGEYTNVTSDEDQEMVVDGFNLEEKHIKERKREEQETIHKQTDILKFEKKKKQVDSPSVKSKINSFNMLLKEKELDDCSYSLTNSKLIKTLSKEKNIQITNSNTNLQEKNICDIKGFLFSETKRDFEPENLNDPNPPINSKLFPKNKEKIIINDRIKHFENILPSALSHTSTSLSHSDKQYQNNSVRNRIAEFENTVLVDNLIKREFNEITKTNEKHINEQNEKQELFIFGGKEYEYKIESETIHKEDKCDTALDSEIKFNVDTIVSHGKIYLEQQNNITKTSYKPKTQHDLNIGKTKESETYLEDISDATSNATLKSKRNLDVIKVFHDKSNVNKYIENKIISNSELDSGMVLNTESYIEDTEYAENIIISNREYKNDMTEMKHNTILDAEVSEYIIETKMKNLKLISDVISNNEKKNDIIIDKEYSEYNEETTDITEDLEYTGKKVPVSDSFYDRVLDSEEIFQVTTTIDSTENVEIIGDILKTECENDRVLEIEDMIDNVTNKQIPFNLEVKENISTVEHECDTKLDVNTLFYENVEECNESCMLLQDNEKKYATNTIYNEINIIEYDMNETMMKLEEKTSISEIKNKYDRILQDDEIVQEKKIAGEKNTKEQNENDFVESKIDDTNFNLEPLICTVENEYNNSLSIDEIAENKIVYVENIKGDHKIVISETSNIENQSNRVPEIKQYKTVFFENECDSIDKDKIFQDNTDVSEGYESLLNAESINNVCIVEQEIKSEDKIIFDECESVISKEMIGEVQQERYTTFYENILQNVTNIHQSIKNEMMDAESNEAMIDINEIENEFEKILDENEIDSEKINIDKIIEDETMLTLEINEITTVDEEFNKILTVNSLQPVKGNIEDVNDHELKNIKGNILFDDENKYNDSENEVNNFNTIEEYIIDPCIFSSSSFKVVSTNEDNLKTIDDITDAKTEDILVIPSGDSIVCSKTAVAKNTNEEFQQLNSNLLNNDIFKTTSETNITDMSDKTSKENKLLKDEFDINLQNVKNSDLSITVLKDIDVDIYEPFNDNISSIDSQERNINDIYNILKDENKLLSTVQECEKVMSIVEPYTNEIRQSLEKLDIGEEIINIQINEQNINFDSGSGNDIINMCDMLQINNENYDETVICRKQSIEEMIYLTNNEEKNLQELEFRTENESDIKIINVDLLRDWEDPFEEIQNDKIAIEQLKETIKDINDYDVLNKNLLSVEQELADVINIEDEELDEEIQNEIAKLDSTVEVTSDDINKIDIQVESLLIPEDVNIEDEELDLKTQEELIKVDSIEIDEGVKEIDKCRKQFLMKSLHDQRETIEDEELDIDTQAEITKVEKIVLNENDKLMNRNLEHKSSMVDKYIMEETFEDVLIDEDEIKFYDDILNKTDDKELENLQSLNNVDNTKPNLEYTNKSLSIQKLNHETIVTDLQTGVTFPDMNNYDFFRGKSINEGLLKPIESTTTSQDSEWSLEENSETNSQHETSFEKNNFTDDNNEILTKPQSINGCTSKSPADTFSELDDFIGNNDSDSGDFHLWSSNIEFGSPPYKYNLCEEMDFDSIISAPNLDEALKKLDKHIQNKREETTKHEKTECDAYDMNIESSGYTILDKTMDDISLEISKYLESESKINVDSAVSSDLTQKLWSVETLDSDINRSSEFSVWETGIDDSENGNWSPIISSFRYPRVLPPQRSIMSLIDEEEERASSRAMNSPLSRMLSKSQDSFGSIKSYDKLQQGYSQSSEESKNECIGILEESDELNIDELNSIENLDNTRDFIIHQNLVGNVDNTDCIPSNMYESIGNVSIERCFADLKTSEQINFIECELSSDLVTQKGSEESTDFHEMKMGVEQNFNYDRLEGNYINLTDVSKTITPEDLDSFVEFTGEIVKSERQEIVNINTTQLHDCGVDYHEENDNVCEKYSTNDNDISKVVEKSKEGFYILGRLQDGSSKEVNVEKLEYQANENREQNINDEIFLKENYYENEIHTLENIERKNKNLNNTIEDGVEEIENIEKVLNDTENEDNKSVSLNSVHLKDDILLAEEIGDNLSVNERKCYWDKKLETMKTDNDLEMSDKKRVDKVKPGNVSQLVSSFNDVPLENTDTFFKKSDYSMQTTECEEIEKEREVSKKIEQYGDIDVNNLKHPQEENESKHVKCPKIITDESSLNTTKINYVTSEEPNIFFSEKDNMLSIEEQTIHKENKNLEHTEHIEKETIPSDLVKKWKNYWDEFITEQNENQTSKHLISNVTGIVSNVKHQFEFSKNIKQEETIMIKKLPSVKENIQIGTENIPIFKKTISINDDIQEITTRESDDEIEEDSHYIDRNDLFLQKVKETHIETKNIVLERIKIFEKGNNTDLNENNKHGFSRNSKYNFYEKPTDSTKWKNNMHDIDDEINTKEKLCDNNLLAKPIERARSYSTGNIDIDIGLGNDDNNYKKNIVEEKEIEGKSSPKSNDDKIDCKIRFERAKQFFKVLEKTNVGERQDRCYHSMPRMDIALIRDSKLSIDSDSGTETRCQRKRDRIRGRRKKKKDIKVRSAPTSDTESCKRISDREDYNFGSERHKKLSERFHVKGLFRDISGDSDGFFRGIPHREAVLASLRSVDDVTVSPYEMDYRKLRPSKSVSSIPEGFQEEYPYLPTTPPSRYRPRSALEFHLIPRSVLIDLNI